MELEVDGERYRFAAARVAGRTFRGLLAGPTGKVWADRFELEDFPGVVRAGGASCSRCAPEQIEVVAGDKE